MTEPAIYRKTIIDSVQLTGWTPDMVQRALAALSDLCAARTAAPADDDAQLASELTRCLRCAAHDDPTSLVDYLDEMQPSGEHESHWEKLECLLAQDEPLEVATRLVQERYSAPVPVLCILLDEKLDPCAVYCDIERHYQRAVEILLALGTRESLTYLLAHMGLLCWIDADLLCELVQAHGASFIDLTVDAWPRLDWIDRTHLLEIYRQCEFDAAPLRDLLFAVDTDSIDYEPLGHYIETLAASEDPRTVPTIERLITRALDDLERQRNEEADRFARKAGRLLVAELEHRVGGDLRRRAAKVGIRW